MNTNSTIYSSLHQFAAAYDCNTYGADAYNVGGECTTGTATEQPATQPASNGLADTGVNTYIFIGLAALFVMAGIALIVRAVIAKRRRSTQS